MAAGAGIGFGTGDAIVVAGKSERAVRIRKRRAGPFSQRPSRAFLGSEVRLEELPAVTDQFRHRRIKLFAVLQMTRDGDFAPDSFDFPAVR